MARRRATGDGDLREKYIAHLVGSYETKAHPERMAPQIAAAQAGVAVVVAGWQLGLPGDTNYCLEENGDVTEVERIRGPIGPLYVRPDGTMAPE